MNETEINEISPIGWEHLTPEWEGRILYEPPELMEEGPLSEKNPPEDPKYLNPLRVVVIATNADTGDVGILRTSVYQDRRAVRVRWKSKELTLKEDIALFLTPEAALKYAIQQERNYIEQRKRWVDRAVRYLFSEKR